MRNRKASINNVLVAHQQNQMIRRAILATGNAKEFEQMRRVYSAILSNSKTAYAGTESEKYLLKNVFRRAAVRQIKQMLRENTRFRRAYSLAFV